MTQWQFYVHIHALVEVTADTEDEAMTLAIEKAVRDADVERVQTARKASDRAPQTFSIAPSGEPPASVRILRGSDRDVW